MKPTLICLALLAAPLIAAAQVPPTPPTPPVPPTPPSSSEWRDYGDQWKDWAKNYSKAMKDYAKDFDEKFADAYDQDEKYDKKLDQKYERKYDRDRDSDNERDDQDGETIDTTVAFSGSGGIVDLGIIPRAPLPSAGGHAAKPRSTRRAKKGASTSSTARIAFCSMSGSTTMATASSTLPSRSARVCL